MSVLSACFNINKYKIEKIVLNVGCNVVLEKLNQHFEKAQHQVRNVEIDNFISNTIYTQEK